MSAERHVAKAGTLICVDHGEYSDYSINGFFVALRDFVPADELDAYMKEFPDQAEDYSFDEDRFLPWLIARGAILEIEYGTLHIGAYGCASMFSFTPSVLP